MKILIVDDEPHVRLLLEQTLEDLEEEGVEILTASDGQQGLDTIRKEQPNLVFLDVMMPHINGFEVCKIVKQDLKMDGVTIVLLTAKGQEYDRQRGEDSGADKYMTKPFDPDALLALAEETLGL
jgi:DNA-binding response OmpR family regulator